MKKSVLLSYFLLLFCFLAAPVFLAEAQTTKYTQQEIFNRIFNDAGTSAIQTLLTGISPDGAVLADGYIWIGNSSNLASTQTVSGDATMSNVGVVAIGASKVTNAMLAGSIADSKLNQITTASKVAPGSIAAGTLTTSDLVLTYGINAGTGVFSGALSATTLNTGNGANELYPMDQSVMTTAQPTFKDVSATFGVSAATSAFTGAVSAASFAATGFIQLSSKTKAQIAALTPTAAGQLYHCSDCAAVTVCISTDTVVASFSLITNKAAVCE